MTGWLESVVGPDYAAALMWTIAALIALLVLLILIRIFRGFGVGTFVAGGRNRKTRLAVMDATAVDSHRRLVLVRRDDVEHLILIGGPSDVVVEQNIRLIAPTRRVSEDDLPRRPHVQETAMELPPAPPRMQPAPRPIPATPTRQAPVVPAPVAPVTATSSQPPLIGTEQPRAPQTQAPPVDATAYAPASPQRAPASQPVQRMAAPAPHAAPASLAPSAVIPSPKSEIDEALLKELELSLDNQSHATPPVVAGPAVAVNEPEKTLDEEMSRLLNDLAGQR